MTWSARRQLVIFIGLVLLGLIWLTIFLVPRISTKPTCLDNKQNGKETGIDCGGICPNYCPAEVAPLVVRWARAFPVTDRIYNVLAYVDNKNDLASIKKIDYEFRVYDKNNTFITRRQGSTFIGETGSFGIFESSLDMGTAIPERTTLTFLPGELEWVKIDPEIGKLRVPITNIVLDNETAAPRLSALATNISPFYTIPDLNVLAILYNKDDNAINVSKTHIDVLPPGGQKNIYFTWPAPFTEEVIREEIIPLIPVFEVSR